MENKGELMFIRNNSLAVSTKDGHYIQTGSKGSPDILVFISEGIPQDLYCMWVLKTIAFEIKTEKAKQSQSQKEWQVKFEKLGGEYYIIRRVEEVIKIIEAKILQSRF